MGKNISIGIIALICATTFLVGCKKVRRHRHYYLGPSNQPPSVSLTTVSFGFGFDASGVDCKASATHTELDGITKYKVIPMKDGAVLGDPGDSFSIGVTIAQGASANCKFIPLGIIV